MSSYVNFFLKGTNGDYLPISSCSRSSIVYEVIEPIINYGTKRALGESDISYVIEQTKQVIDDYKRMIAGNINDRTDILSMNNSVADKMEMLGKINARDRELKELLEEAYCALSFFRTLDDCITEAGYTGRDKNPISADDYVYAGIECAREDEQKGETNVLYI